MIARLHSATVIGVDGVKIEVEVDLRPNPERRTFIVGLPDTAVKESAQRVESAIINSRLIPAMGGIIVVNLAPADLKKQGPGFDLPIALGILACSQNIELNTQDWCIAGELALDGGVRSVQGILPIAIEARRHGMTKLMVPMDNAAEASAVTGIQLCPVATLEEAWQYISGMRPVEACSPALPCPEEPNTLVDYQEIKGQVYARRAMEITAAGGHNILMSGSPGSGKSMLAQRLPTILPPLADEEALEASKIHSVCGLLKRGHGLLARRPFRAPHHTISDVGLMGGGTNITPGEISLAHHGVLFLDELPEFRRQTLETLRQPLEAGSIVISRASGTMTFPCRFMLVAAMNPCPCGYLGDRRRACKCSLNQIAKYRQKISGPLLDRFDIIIDVPPVDPQTLTHAPAGEASADMRGRVARARAIQQTRYAGTSIPHNAALHGTYLRQYCALTQEGMQIVRDAINQLCLSARAYDRILKIARTIADLADSADIQNEHIYEAVQLRSYEQQMRG